MLYRVEVNDSLSSIALVQLGDMEKWKDIARLNNLAPPYIIHPNELLLLPDSEAPAPIRITKPPAPKKTNAGWWIAAAGIASLFLLGG